ncbi:ATPase, T2SS/T4P/T4SS family [Psychromonas sp. SP041]|uniref:GspE/PulE family protein n=1 Tax=Psychromonas sp. SP041 TaxID=1365007 RepID=UPI0010C79FF0|nr:ATPase, T2SS/T4P/T4SS family [Psychromonas sp. SP041]
MSLNNFIDSLFQRKKPKKKAGSQIIKKKNSSNSKVPTKPRVKSSTSGTETITKKENVPNYEKVISYQDEEIPLNEEQRRNYIVLLVNPSKKMVSIICSTESNSRAQVDNTYLTIKNKCVDKGYSVTKLIAPRQIIQITYEKDEKIKDTDSFDRARKEGFISDFDSLVTQALREKVSDIHFEVRRKEARVRFRKHGELYTFTPWTVAYARDMSSVVYQVMADEKEPSFIETKSQAARIERRIDGQDLGIRLNTLSASQGFDLIMRILKLDDESESDRIIDTLGYSEGSLVEIYRAMSRPTGVIIVAGTTGSGKSTTISTMLNTIIKENWGDDGPKIKVITVEDPTEYTIIGATQHGVVRNRNRPNENPFAEAIKHAMRCDPDILMVGEVRDEYSAKLLVGAVQSGHTAFTTVHAASAVGIIPRLKSFGVNSETLGSSDFISALIYQTLLPISCPDCSISYSDFVKEAEKSKNKKSLSIIKRVKGAAKGLTVENVRFRNYSNEHKCKNPECVNGVVGRTVVAEVISPNPLILSAFEKGSVNLATYYHVKMGGKLIKDHAIEKVLNGITDPRDAEKKVDLLDDVIDLDLLEKSLKLTAEEVSSTDKRSDSIHKQNKDEKESFQSKLFKEEDDLSEENNSPAQVLSFCKDDETDC